MKNTIYLLTVIVPTYNEVDNISNFINKIKEILKNINFQILFVDDNSTDGTIDKVNKFKERYDNIELIVRIGRRGLSGACIEGIQNAKSNYVAIIDCDLQHDEKLLLKMLQSFEKEELLDLVIGSRHVEEGGFSKAYLILEI